MANLFTRIFGTRNDRMLRRYARVVDRINALEPEMQALSDDELKGRTQAFRQRLDAGESLDDILPEAFAAAREASVRTLGMRHFDVQLIGGMVLHDGKISEMRTGEGKTLMSTLPAYLNAIPADRSVHVVTVNDYLASRDAKWMEPIYRALGLKVGVIYSGQDPKDKRDAYRADITYGTNNEFGFDYLRDNLAPRLEAKAQGPLSFAIVDEVDSILIDEARTPLIISGPAEDNTELYLKIDRLIPSLVPVEEKDGPGDYTLEEKHKQIYLTEEGHEKVEELLHQHGLIEAGESLYDAKNIALMHHVNAALRAHTMYLKDVDYIVSDGQVVIVDEFTGRTMPGRRWSEGLHQAVEAKEGVKVQQENQTLASITFQNFFRMYEKLSGMTGTADTEAFEFQQIYGLEVAVIPTHKPMIREDFPDLVYLTKRDKFQAIIDDIKVIREAGRPTLVGTTSIETSEYISGLLKKESIPHQVLNAKQHEREAQIIEEAGRPGAVTIATNMAGRGTDIVLGGNPDSEIAEAGEEGGKADVVRAEWKQRHEAVVEAGGLHIIGTERHESRRIDNQLRGRAGRQGDPGSSRFYLSFDDTLMRIFASDRTRGIIERLGLSEGEVIESKMVSKQIERAQRKVESFNFDMRKQLLEYDDVANDQRKVVYSLRDQLLGDEEFGDTMADIRDEVVEGIIDEYVPPGSVEEQWDPEGLERVLEAELATPLPVREWLDTEHELDEDGLRERIRDRVRESHESKSAQLKPEVMRQLEKHVMLQQLDNNWRAHLADMDHLRQGIHLRGYAQKNPKQEYKREAFIMFTDMLDRVRRETVSLLARIQVKTEDEVREAEAERHAPSRIETRHEDAASALSQPQPQAAAAGVGAAVGGAVAGGGAQRRPSQAPEPPQTFVRDQPKVGRNDPCPCGSGKKYKQCHGRAG